MPYPHNCWTLVTGAYYQDNLVYFHPPTGDYAWEDREHLVCLPTAIALCLRAGERGHF